MADAKICDRYGKFYVMNEKEFKGCSLRHQTNTTQSMFFDLCDECVEKLWGFLINQTKEDEKNNEF